MLAWPGIIITWALLQRFPGNKLSVSQWRDDGRRATRWLRWLYFWGFPKMGGFPPQIIHGLLGFSIINLIHFGGNTPIFGNTHIYPCWGWLKNLMARFMIQSFSGEAAGQVESQRIWGFLHFEFTLSSDPTYLVFVESKYSYIKYWVISGSYWIKDDCQPGCHVASIDGTLLTYAHVSCQKWFSAQYGWNIYHGCPTYPH